MRGAEKLLGLVIYINEKPYIITDFYYTIEFETFYVKVTNHDGATKNYPINDIIPFLRNKFTNGL